MYGRGRAYKEQENGGVIEQCECARYIALGGKEISLERSEKGSICISEEEKLIVQRGNSAGQVLRDKIENRRAETSRGKEHAKRRRGRSLLPDLLLRVRVDAVYLDDGWALGQVSSDDDLKNQLYEQTDRG